MVKVDSDGWSTSYYEIPEGAVELQDLIEHKKMNFAVGNIFKSAYRLGGKGGIDAEYDLNKIVWFAQRELRRIKNGRHDQRQSTEAAGEHAEVTEGRNLPNDPNQRRRGPEYDPKFGFNSV